MALMHKNRNKDISCIDQMEALLEQINAFEEVYSTSKSKADPNYRQEYRLFQQHIKWVSEDLVKPVRYNVRNK